MGVLPAHIIRCCENLICGSGPPKKIILWLQEPFLFKRFLVSCSSRKMRTFFWPSNSELSQEAGNPVPEQKSSNFPSKKRSRWTWRSNGFCSMLCYYFPITSQPMYFLRASGMTTEPSACWQFSSMAATVLPTARPEPLRVWTNSALPVSSFL